ncbi:Crp/Fnr family transcriptional regulator [Parapedobacter koreensis]|uniref:cAMP-binding domain of CRP or a regulatory subunit of cAMP-dependent protein kinases n=1 Tax=Parapedobacter koreensis TaxID=332977 RepID=A0A1H7TWK1_9SPHI|nr:Crp/Fnr family transcriptional regulator [Parapedobacter koreensis]SEL88945.1 cAMP-binding domain of CRP or a regulatory subunit of cAMP-dependent protein kinases [Parapedobacter koreensis]
MKQTYHTPASAFVPLLFYWTHYCPLDVSHHEWLHIHGKELTAKRGTRLFEPGDRGDYVYFVCDGLLATAWWDAEGNRRIDRFLPPLHSALTRNNLYTHRQVDYEVVALRKSVLICIPANALKAYKETCTEANTLVHVMEQKKLKQYRKKSRLMLIKHEIARYRAFATDDYMKSMRLLTFQEEQADYLGISRRTIARAMEQL